MALLIALPKIKGMVEDHGASEHENFPGPGPERQRATGPKSPYLGSAEQDDRCPGSNDCRRCMNDSRFCHF